ncbi:MAG TPA: BTAD domain-containing putative transcriptional regulator [Longimicrobium sp.]|nr:BTAD domain-containing putative transcriptional regulator [Longimicrobium sp.]
MYLKTLGHPALYHADGTPVEGLRKKDLALLVYLCVEGSPVHARERLASLLWEGRKERVRHSLTQALGRLGRVLPRGTLAAEKDVVRWGEGLECDATALLRGEVEPGEVDDAFSLHAEPFLEGFHPGTGAGDFEAWAGRRRAELRNAALLLLECAGEDAVAARDWSRALRLAEREVQIDPVWEQGHRRLMRAMAARGERNRALRHYQAFAEWLAQEVGARPDPETHALAEHLRALDAPAGQADPAPAAPAGPGPVPAAAPEPSLATARDSPPDPPAVPAPAPASASAPAAEPVPGPPPPRVPGSPGSGRGLRKAMIRGAALLAAVLFGLWLLAVAKSRTGPPREEPPPAHGEHVRLRGSPRTYLAFAETLWAYPDSATLSACTGRRPQVAREVRSLPGWPRRALPSVLHHPWMRGAAPVVSDHPWDRTAFAVTGCIRAGVPTPSTLDSIFGAGALGRMLVVEDSVLRRLPRAFVARGHPLRRAGTLIRAPHGALRWITWHGGALAVDDRRVLATHCRTPAEAVPVSAREFEYYRPFGTLHRSSQACRHEPG